MQEKSQKKTKKNSKKANLGGKHTAKMHNEKPTNSRDNTKKSRLIVGTIGRIKENPPLCGREVDGMEFISVN